MASPRVGSNRLGPGKQACAGAGSSSLAGESRYNQDYSMVRHVGEAAISKDRRGSGPADPATESEDRPGLEETVMRLYVGNLPYSVNDAELESMFAEFGDVSSAQVVIDRQTGRSRGFGFVELPNDEEAERAMTEMNGRDSGGRALVVNEARERSSGPGGPRRGGGGGQW